MRLAILIGHFPPAAWGGSELQAEGWARRLARRHEVTVVTRADHLRPPGRESRDGYAIVRLEVSRVPGWRTLADLVGIERTLAGLEPRPELLLCFQTFISGLAGTRAGARLGIPALVWVRGEAEYRLADSLLARVTSPRVWDAAAAVLVQSKSIRAQLIAQLERHAPQIAQRVRGRVAVMENGLDLPAPDPSPGEGVVSVGRLIHDKGMDLALAACARSRQPLTVVGDGPERATLEALARSLGTNVRFTGQLEREALAAIYARAGTVVLAARRGEGLPNVLLEAMAHGRAVVATPCAGTQDLLTDGLNGLLVPAGDVDALANALTRLAADPALRARLGASARATAERFDWARIEPRLESLLERWRRA